MNAQLINLGFVQKSLKRYVHYELDFWVELQDDGSVDVMTDAGIINTTIDELEEVMVLGGFEG
jgi:hypothetical protein